MSRSLKPLTLSFRYLHPTGGVCDTRKVYYRCRMISESEARRIAHNLFCPFTLVVSCYCEWGMRAWSGLTSARVRVF